MTTYNNSGIFLQPIFKDISMKKNDAQKFLQNLDRDQLLSRNHSKI